MARISWLGHATVLIDLDGTRLLTDPVLRRRVAHLVRVVDDAPMPDRVDAVLLSHAHRDHADVPTLRRLPGIDVIAPLAARGVLQRTGAGSVRELSPGQETGVGGVTVRATPAVHDGRRNPVGAPAEALGFLIDGPLRIYFAGDTDLFAGMVELAEPPIDVALLPVWGWGPRLGPGHLDPERAAEAVALLRPRIVVPIHWGTYAPIVSRPRLRLGSDAPARLFAALVAQRTPEVEVAVLAPGETLEVASPRGRIRRAP
jgi:L-ascorbate metabolism protein UlaG (beta-lactamase superfamily)